jgi:hypothetical protein
MKEADRHGCFPACAASPGWPFHPKRFRLSMHLISMNERSDQVQLRARVETILAHLWMVRTFLKHAPEFEDDVELMRIPRAIFDFVRALETRMGAEDPQQLLKMLRKKLPRLEAAAEEFAGQREEISDHTNFKMAAVSLSGCVGELGEILSSAESSAGAPGGSIRGDCRQ